MGTNCAHLVADLFLFCYERDFMMSLSDDKQAEVIDAFNTTSRYLDDILNKGIEFINLPSIFKDKSVISSIPIYFENKESPIICYKYNKPIRSTVFNYNKLVTELDI